MLIAQDPGSKLVISHREGGRATEDAVELFEDVESRRDQGIGLPLFMSDEWDAYAEGLLKVYGEFEMPPYEGRGRPPLPKLVPPEDLRYAQVVKHRENDRVIKVDTRVVFGNEAEVRSLLEQSGNTINTSYVERNNLTLRNGVSRLIRKTMNFSKCMEPLSAHVRLFIAWFNFVKPHKSLRRRKRGRYPRYTKRTPAMATMLTDHIWSLEELMTFRVPKSMN